MEVLLVYLSGVVLVAVVMGFIWWKSGDDLTIRVAYMLGCLMLLSYFSFVLILYMAVDCWLDRRGDEVIIKRGNDNEEQEDEEARQAFSPALNYMMDALIDGAWDEEKQQVK